MKNFMAIDSVTSDKFFITYSDEVYRYFYEGFNQHASSSYVFIPARVLGMDYIDYLRMMRDKYNGILRYKVGYPVCYFDTREDANIVCKLLEEYWKKKKVS